MPVDDRMNSYVKSNAEQIVRTFDRDDLLPITIEFVFNDVVASINESVEHISGIFPDIETRLIRESLLAELYDTISNDTLKDHLQDYIVNTFIEEHREQIEDLYDNLTAYGNHDKQEINRNIAYFISGLFDYNEYTADRFNIICWSNISSVTIDDDTIDIRDIIQHEACLSDDSSAYNLELFEPDSIRNIQLVADCINDAPDIIFEIDDGLLSRLIRAGYDEIVILGLRSINPGNVLELARRNRTVSLMLKAPGVLDRVVSSMPSLVAEPDFPVQWWTRLDSVTAISVLSQLEPSDLLELVGRSYTVGALMRDQGVLDAVVTEHPSIVTDARFRDNWFALLSHDVLINTVIENYPNIIFDIPRTFFVTRDPNTGRSVNVNLDVVAAAIRKDSSILDNMLNYSEDNNTMRLLLQEGLMNEDILLAHASHADTNPNVLHIFTRSAYKNEIINSIPSEVFERVSVLAISKNPSLLGNINYTDFSFLFQQTDSLTIADCNVNGHSNISDLFQRMFENKNGYTETRASYKQLLPGIYDLLLKALSEHTVSFNSIDRSLHSIKLIGDYAMICLERGAERGGYLGQEFRKLSEGAQIGYIKYRHDNGLWTGNEFKLMSHNACVALDDPFTALAIGLIDTASYKYQTSSMDISPESIGVILDDCDMIPEDKMGILKEALSTRAMSYEYFTKNICPFGCSRLFIDDQVSLARLAIRADVGNIRFVPFKYQPYLKDACDSALTISGISVVPYISTELYGYDNWISKVSTLCSSESASSIGKCLDILIDDKRINLYDAYKIVGSKPAVKNHLSEKAKTSVASVESTIKTFNQNMEAISPSRAIPAISTGRTEI